MRFPLRKVLKKAIRLLGGVSHNPVTVGFPLCSRWFEGKRPLTSHHPLLQGIDENRIYLYQDYAIQPVTNEIPSTT